MHMMNIITFIGRYLITGIMLIGIIPTILKHIILFIARCKKNTKSVRKVNEILSENAASDITGGTLSNYELENLKSYVNNADNNTLMIFRILSIIFWPVIVFPAYVALFKTGYHALTDEPDGSN